MGAVADLVIDPERPGLYTRADYFDVLRLLRAESPVHGYASNRWALARYDDVRTVSRDPERFCSGRGVLPAADPLRSGAELPGSILHMDPPQHTDWRKVASRWFTPRAVSRLEEKVRAITVEVLDGAQVGEPIDFVEEVSAPIPALVIAELLGMGEVPRGDLRRWSDACIESPDDDPDGEEQIANMLAVGEMLEYLNGQVQARRTEPRDDLLSVLVHAEVEGRPIEDHEVVMYCLSVLVAGNETTRHLLSDMTLALFDHPDQRAALVADRSPDALATAVEESIRWVTPIQAFTRTATVDTELGGQAIAEGDWVVMLYSSANRDESVFGADADVFDSRRPANPAHLAFGFGEHLCLGAALARMEGRVVLDELLARHPDYEVTGEGVLGRSTLVRGFVSLPVRLG